MKILLIYPYFLDERVNVEEISVLPIGLYYIGALLKENNYDVEILNWFDINKNPHMIEEILHEKKPHIIGFSIMHANRWGGIDIAQIAKRILPEVTIIFGGIGTAFLWKHLLKHFREIDYAVLGEGEYSFLNLVRCLENKTYEQLNSLKGIAFRQSGKPVKTENAEAIQNLDDLPMPSKYFTFQHLSSSRGCPSNCTFCGSPKFWGRKVRFHSSEYFIEQIERLYQKGVSFFYVSDDTFTMKKERVIDICKKIVGKGLRISWFAISRVNYVDEEMLFWMRKAGCIQISYGIESGSEKIRKALNKNITLEHIKRAFRLTTGYGILARAYFIYGSPGENWKTIEESMNIIHEIKPLSIIFYILDIFPGTALYEDFRQRTGIDDDIWLQRIEDIMYFESDPVLTQEKILAFGKKLKSDYYQHLASFADSVQVLERDNLREEYADFFSRLAMTFSHGDYAVIDAIPEKEKVAERLYKKSLMYAPNQRAYLGLGIFGQKQGRHEESIRILSEGMQHFPSNESLGICLAVSLMNLARFEEALLCLQNFPNSPDALKYTAACYHELGQYEKESSVIAILKKFSPEGMG